MVEEEEQQEIGEATELDPHSVPDSTLARPKEDLVVKTDTESRVVPPSTESPEERPAKAVGEDGASVVAGKTGEPQVKTLEINEEKNPTDPVAEIVAKDDANMAMMIEEGLDPETVQGTQKVAHTGASFVPTMTEERVTPGNKKKKKKKAKSVSQAKQPETKSAAGTSMGKPVVKNEGNGVADKIRELEEALKAREDQLERQSKEIMEARRNIEVLTSENGKLKNSGPSIPESQVTQMKRYIVCAHDFVFLTMR